MTQKKVILVLIQAQLRLDLGTIRPGLLNLGNMLIILSLFMSEKYHSNTDGRIISIKKKQQGTPF